MNDIQKMFQAIINGQSAFRQEVLGKINKLERKVDKGFEEVNRRIDGTHERIDKIGKSLAYLEDDTPTRDEYDQLENRVGKLEQKVISTNVKL